MEKKVLVLSGPTGSGESTLTNMLVDRFPKFERMVTATSRSPRAGEIDKIDYYFFSTEEFKEHIDDGSIVEYSYIENRDTYYGTYIPDLKKRLDAGKCVVANVDGVGTKYYKLHHDAYAVFIMPESVDDIVDRLRSRNPEMSEEEIEKRVQNARNEITNEKHLYDDVLINADGKLEEAFDALVQKLRDRGFDLGENVA